MRYIISPSQFHKLVYKYLDDIHSKGIVKKEINPYVKSGGTWRLDIFTDEGKSLLQYYWFEPGTDDDDVPHNGVGHLSVSKSLISTLNSHLSVRKTKILDIIGDWVSEKFNVDIDDVNEYN